MNLRLWTWLNSVGAVHVARPDGGQLGQGARRFPARAAEISAVRIDPANHTMSVATIGHVDLADFRGEARRKPWPTWRPQLAAECQAESASRVRAEAGRRRDRAGPRDLRHGREAVVVAGDGMAGDQGRADARGSGMAVAGDARGNLRRRRNRGLARGALRAGSAVVGAGVVPHRTSSQVAGMRPSTHGRTSRSAKSTFIS